MTTFKKDVRLVVRIMDDGTRQIAPATKGEKATPGARDILTQACRRCRAEIGDRRYIQVDGVFRRSYYHKECISI